MRKGSTLSMTLCLAIGLSACGGDMETEHDGTLDSYQTTEETPLDHDEDDSSSTQEHGLSRHTKIKVLINGSKCWDLVNNGYVVNGHTHIQWGVLKVLGVSYKYNGNGNFTIENRNVQGVIINGHTYLKWSELIPGRLTPHKIAGGWNFTFNTTGPAQRKNEKTILDRAWCLTKCGGPAIIKAAVKCSWLIPALPEALPAFGLCTAGWMGTADAPAMAHCIAGCW